MKLLESIFEELQYICVDIRNHIVTFYQYFINRKNFVKTFESLSLWCQQVETIARESDRKGLPSFIVLSRVMRIKNRLLDFNDNNHKLTYGSVYDIVDAVYCIKSILPRLGKGCTP